MLYAKERKIPIIQVSERDNNNTQELFEIQYKYELKKLFLIYYIRPNSPAERVGLKVGDLIYTINDKPTFLYDLQEINNLFFDDIGTKIKVKIQRNGAPYIYEFELKDPL